MGQIFAILAFDSNSVSVHSWTWARVATCKWSLQEKFINHLICRSKSWMFHEAYHVRIKSSRLVKLLQAFDESADWVLLIGVARETWSPCKFLAYIFILCFERCCIKPNTVPRLMSKYTAPPKIWGGYVTGSDFFTLPWFKLERNCIQVTSLHKSDRSESICNFFL